MNAIILDTETNGMIKNWKLELTPSNLKSMPAITLDNFPRIAQLAWQKVDIETEKVIHEFQSLIKPDGWTIPKEKFFIENNMSTERCEAEGIPAVEALDKLVFDMDDCDFIVCHNTAFDIPVVKAEMIRYAKASKNKNIIIICTMKSSTDFCRLPGGRGYKFPKLEELHRILFKEEMSGAHDAMCDVVACRVSFFQLVKLKVILLEK